MEYDSAAPVALTASAPTGAGTSIAIPGATWRWSSRARIKVFTCLSSSPGCDAASAVSLTGAAGAVEEPPPQPAASSVIRARSERRVHPQVQPGLSASDMAPP